MKKNGKLNAKGKDFKKSSFSKNNPKTCVMVAVVKDGVAIRDSKDPTKKTLEFTHVEWEAFLKGAKNDEFNIVK